MVRRGGGFAARDGAARAAAASMKRGAALLLLILTALGPIYEWGGPAHRGVRALRGRRYDEALQALRAGRSEMPNSAVIPYDEGLAHLGRGETDSAQVRF